MKLYQDVSALINMLPRSRAAIYAAANRGDIPSIRVGKRVFIPTTYIDRLRARAEEAGQEGGGKT